MHRLLVIILSVMLIVAPVSAQQSPVTPEPVIVEPGSGLTVSLPE